MFRELEVFKAAVSMARHAGFRQAITAQNIANVDTPGYQARLTQDFSQLVSANRRGHAIRATRLNHNADTPTSFQLEFSRGPTANPNGNGVALQDEILSAVEVKRQHDRAISIYRASLDLVRGTLSKQ